MFILEVSKCLFFKKKNVYCKIIQIWSYKIHRIFLIPLLFKKEKKSVQIMRVYKMWVNFLKTY